MLNRNLDQIFTHAFEDGTGQGVLVSQVVKRLM